MALGPFYVSSYIWRRIKIIFAITKWLGNTGGSLSYPPTLNFQCLDVRCKILTIFFCGSRSNPVSALPEDRKFITLTSSKGGGMIPHNLHNLVSDIPEEECDITSELLKLQVDYH